MRLGTFALKLGSHGIALSTSTLLYIRILKMVRKYVRKMQNHKVSIPYPQGFTEAPGDTLAFWYFRMANETREPEKRARLLEKAAAVAESESAKERVADSS